MPRSKSKLRTDDLPLLSMGHLLPESWHPDAEDWSTVLELQSPNMHWGGLRPAVQLSRQGSVVTVVCMGRTALLRLVWTRGNGSARRAWLLCPFCESRTRLLRLQAAAGCRWACWRCCGLRYGSVAMTAPMERARRHLRNVRTAAIPGSEGASDGFPIIPDWMTRRQAFTLEKAAAHFELAWVQHVAPLLARGGALGRGLEQALAAADTVMKRSKRRRRATP
jgi:hypothetical protein